MKNDDDDILTGSVPDPDSEPTAAERAHAKAFADLLDKTLASGRMPPAMSADDRALLEVTTVIRATHSQLDLSPSKSRSLVEDALRQAIGGGNAATSLSSGAPVTPIKRRWLPWAVAGTATLVAAAAILLLIIRRPKIVEVQAPTAQVDVAPPVPEHWKSRPTDALIGPIDSECNGPALDCARTATVKASARIDTIYSDRLAGYRDRRFARRGKR